MTKEDIYDNEISPLMTQVIELCKTHGIAMIANFATPSDEDASVQALTMLPDETKKHPANHMEALYCIRPSARQPMMLRTMDAAGGLTLTAIL